MIPIDELIEALKSFTIDDDYRAFEDDEEPGVQVTLACNDADGEYALQTGDNCYTGVAYGFPHWAVSAVYRDSNYADVAAELLNQLAELVNDQL